MAKTEVRWVGEFQAKDEFGNTYTVNEYQELIEARSFNQPTEWLEGMKILELDDGSKVNFLDDRTFQIVSTNTILRRL